jgi:putative transposase
MMRNRRLSRSIADQGFGEFRRQLEYKAAMCGREVVVADRWFASSKTCSGCGFELKEVFLSVRSWQCPVCTAKHDRDINAAINLRNYAVSSTVSACGEGGAGLGRKPKVKPPSMKQEANSRFAQV